MEQKISISGLKKKKKNIYFVSNGPAKAGLCFLWFSDHPSNSSYNPFQINSTDIYLFPVILSFINNYLSSILLYKIEFFQIHNFHQYKFSWLSLLGFGGFWITRLNCGMDLQLNSVSPSARLGSFFFCLFIQIRVLMRIWISVSVCPFVCTVVLFGLSGWLSDIYIIMGCGFNWWVLSHLYCLGTWSIWMSFVSVHTMLVGLSCVAVASVSRSRIYETVDMFIWVDKARVDEYLVYHWELFLVSTCLKKVDQLLHYMLIILLLIIT